MDDLTPFERRLAAGLKAYAGPRRAVDEATVAREAAKRPPTRLGVLARLNREPRSGRLPWRLIGVAALLVVSMGGGAVFFGSGQTPWPVGRGDLITYTSGGDIHVGDPSTGETTAIVTGSEIDSGPIFSPDGTRIAFLRGDPWTAEASILVVRPDGSDERTVMPADFSQRGSSFTWTPDGVSLLVNHDSEPFTTPYFDGELSLFDASGVAEPRLLTPPLPIGPGGPYFSYTHQVAPMFRPPNGDLILSHASEATVPDAAGGRGINVWDVHLESHTLLEPEALKRFQPYSVSPWGLWWSPDGSMIAFMVGGTPAGDGLYVMDADGSGVQRLDNIGGGPLAWSPDSTRLAIERCESTPAGDGAVIVIVDVISGAEQVLGSPSVLTKTEGVAMTRPPETAGQAVCGWYSGPTGRAWDYEGWSWSPDGRSIVMLERQGTRPLVIDVQTGEATELPWEADSVPSWRFVRPSSPE